MKISKHISCALAFIITVSFTGCAEKEKGPVEFIPTAPESFIFDWQTPYTAKLEEFMKTEGFSSDNSRFDLRDITGDGVPELFISPDTEKTTHCAVYTFSEGNVSLMFELGSEGMLPWYPEKNIIKDEYRGDSLVVGTYMIYEEGEFKTYLTYTDNSGSAAGGAVIIHELNGESVTLPQYDAAMAEFSGLPVLCLGRKYTFGQEAIEYAVHSGEAWGKAVTDIQRDQLYNTLSETLVNARAAGAGSTNSAFELCDLNGDDVPELVISDGSEAGSICRIFSFIGDMYDTLTEASGTYGSEGRFTFDITQNRFFADVNGETTVWNLSGSTASADFTSSVSCMECGRKFLLTDENIRTQLYPKAAAEEMAAESTSEAESGDTDVSEESEDSESAEE